MHRLTCNLARPFILCSPSSSALNMKAKENTYYTILNHDRMKKCTPFVVSKGCFLTSSSELLSASSSCSSLSVTSSSESKIKNSNKRQAVSTQLARGVKIIAQIEIYLSEKNICSALQPGSTWKRLGL